MERFFGIMPSNEIKRQETHKDKYGRKVIIQAGPKGWAVVLSDDSTIYRDDEAPTDDNFKTAYDAADGVVGPLSPMDGFRECVEEEI